MVPLIILIATFVVFSLINSFVLSNRLSMSLVGRAALSMMLISTGIAHFTDAAPMIQMIPDPIPLKSELILFTGVCEILAAIGLLWERTSRLTGYMLIVFFLAILPANVHGSLNSVPFGGMENGPWYLFFRIPLQIVFIVWTWVFAVISVGGRNGLRTEN